MSCYLPIGRTVFVDDDLGNKHQFTFKTSCGKCPSCLKRKKKNWIFRLLLESRAFPKDRRFFLTLTFDEPNYYRLKKTDGFKREWQLFMKRLRKKFSDDKIRYFQTSEFGEQTGRFHFHVILFGVKFDKDNPEIFRDVWRNGHVSLSTLTFEKVCYCTAYLFTPTPLGSPIKPFHTMSLRPGIGSNYIPIIKKYVYKTLKQDGTCQYLFDINGFKYPIPPYYIRKCLLPYPFREQRYEAAQRQYNNAVLNLSWGAKFTDYFAEKVRLNPTPPDDLLFDRSSHLLLNDNNEYLSHLDDASRVLSSLKVYKPVKLVKVRSHYEYIFKDSADENSTK